MKKAILFIALTIGAIGYNQAQDIKEVDFLVKTTGDTLTGKFKYKDGSGGIKAKITVKVNDTLKVTLKASEVKYFKEGENEYISFEPKGEEGSYFIKIIVLGKYLELYEWQLPVELSDGKKIELFSYIRKKGDKTFMELDHVTWKKELPNIIGDYEELADAVWKGKYKLEQLGEIITMYNKWKEGDN